MTATSAFSAVLRGSRTLGKQPPFLRRGIASSIRPARVSQGRSRQPLLCAVLGGERSPFGAGRGLDLQLHRPLGGEGRHLAHEIAVRILLHELEKRHPLAGLVVSPVGSRSGQPEPMPKTGDGRPRGSAHGLLHHPLGHDRGSPTDPVLYETPATRHGVVALREKPSVPLSSWVRATRVISAEPGAEKRFIGATRAWVSAACRSGSRAAMRSARGRGSRRIPASIRLRAWYPVRRLRTARRWWRVARRVSLRARAAGASSFHALPRLADRDDRLGAACGDGRAAATRGRRAPSALAAPLSSSSGTRPSGSASARPSPSRPGASSTARMPEVAASITRCARRHRRRRCGPRSRAGHSQSPGTSIPVPSTSGCGGQVQRPGAAARRHGVRGPARRGSSAGGAGSSGPGRAVRVERSGTGRSSPAGLGSAATIPAARPSGGSNGTSTDSSEPDRRARDHRRASGPPAARRAPRHPPVHPDRRRAAPRQRGVAVRPVRHTPADGRKASSSSPTVRLGARGEPLADRVLQQRHAGPIGMARRGLGLEVAPLVGHRHPRGDRRARRGVHALPEPRPLPAVEEHPAIDAAEPVPAAFGVARQLPPRRFACVRSEPSPRRAGRPRGRSPRLSLGCRCGARSERWARSPASPGCSPARPDRPRRGCAGPPVRAGRRRARAAAPQGAP